MPFISFLFSIGGRVRRREFGLFALVMGAVFLNWICGVRDLAGKAHVYSNAVPDGYLANLLAHSDTHYASLALMILITYTVAAKRLHDRGKSGWWLLVGFVPVIGWAWLIVELFVLPGSPGDNRYGPHPTFNAEAAERDALRIRYKR